LREQIVSLQKQEHFLKVQLQFATALQDSLSVDVIVQRLQMAINNAFSGSVAVRRINPGNLELEEIRMVRYSDTRCRLQFGAEQDGLDIELDDIHIGEQWYTVLDTLFQQARLAITRSEMVRQVQNERLRAEQEHLRSALLASVSHDLKTPLASMIGAASTLKDLSADLSETDKKDLLESVLEEAHRLEGYIQNLLDMTRLGQGELTLEREWIGIDEIIHVVVKRTQPIKGERQIDVQLAPDLPLVYVHPALIGQALFNVLENAIKFSPPQSVIKIVVSIPLNEPFMQVDIIDEGPGIPPAHRHKVFDMFHSVSRGDYHQAGTGLGLAICQGMLGAHGGRAEVIDTDSGVGVCIRILIPLHDVPQKDVIDNP
jgi:two-component system sensor histidine kinase KdpD